MFFEFFLEFLGFFEQKQGKNPKKSHQIFQYK